MISNNIYDSIIIGGGIAGCLSALKLSKDKRVLLLEREFELLSNNSSSYNGCYKIHSGLHFLKDLNTAKLCLYKGIQFVKEYSQFLLGYDINDELNKHLKKSRFYLMSNSLISLKEALENSNELIKYYKELIQNDISNKVLGEEDEFIKILPLNYYSDVISNEIDWYDENDQLIKIKVLLCFEYNEYILDFQKFKNHIINNINMSNNLNIIYNYNVKLINKIDTSNNYIVSSNEPTLDNYKSKSIINCSFENIEILDKQLFNIENKNCIIRIKCSIVIKIPDSMKTLSSFLFGIGPFCGFLINQNNKLVLVSERSSNIANFNPNESIPESIKLLLNNCTLKSNQGKEIANSILIECSKFLNEPYKSDILNSNILELKKGYVKIYQNEIYTIKSLYNSNSGVHVRSEELIFRSNNYISNCSTKMTYSLDDSNLILNHLNKNI